MGILNRRVSLYSGPLLCDPSVEQFPLLWDCPSLVLGFTFWCKPPPDERPPLLRDRFSLAEGVVTQERGHCTDYSHIHQPTLPWLLVSYTFAFCNGDMGYDPIGAMAPSKYFFSGWRWKLHSLIWPRCIEKNGCRSSAATVECCKLHIGVNGWLDSDCFCVCCKVLYSSSTTNNWVGVNLMFCLAYFRPDYCHYKTMQILPAVCCLQYLSPVHCLLPVWNSNIRNFWDVERIFDVRVSGSSGCK